MIGGGYIGLELAEAFVKRHAEVTVIERAPELMGASRPRHGGPGHRRLPEGRHHGAARRAGRGHRGGCGHHRSAHRARSTWSCSASASSPTPGWPPRPGSLGLRRQGLDRRGPPPADLGRGGLGRRRLLPVPLPGDRRSRSTSPSARWPTSRAGSPASTSVAGTPPFPGVVGTAVTKLCALEIGRTGAYGEGSRPGRLRLRVGQDRGDHQGRLLPRSRARSPSSCWPRRARGGVLGAQIVGAEGAAKRIDVLATAITAGMTVFDVIDLDLSYAPPFSLGLGPGAGGRPPSRPDVGRAVGGWRRRGRRRSGPGDPAPPIASGWSWMPHW